MESTYPEEVEGRLSDEGGSNSSSVRHSLDESSPMRDLVSRGEVDGHDHSKKARLKTKGNAGTTDEFSEDTQVRHVQRLGQAEASQHLGGASNVVQFGIANQSERDTEVSTNHQEDEGREFGANASDQRVKTHDERRTFRGERENKIRQEGRKRLKTFQ